MKPFQKIAILGGTGKSGKYLVAQLLDRGHQVKLLLRKPKSLLVNNPLMETIEGDARDFDSIKTLLKDCDAVISTLGQPSGEPAIFSQASRNVMQAMADWKIDRYIVTTGLQVDTPSDNKPALCIRVSIGLAEIRDLGENSIHPLPSFSGQRDLEDLFVGV